MVKKINKFALQTKFSSILLHCFYKQHTGGNVWKNYHWLNLNCTVSQWNFIEQEIKKLGLFIKPEGHMTLRHDKFFEENYLTFYLLRLSVNAFFIKMLQLTANSISIISNIIKAYVKVLATDTSYRFLFSKWAHLVYLIT